ncbi:MAG TPA: DUF1801 domain-containing protein [Saprospiraceae bacterium]|nr:DUF1801 domain-containing protein [Saprospiraceae bacterium]
MSKENKTKETTQSIDEFIDSFVESDQKKEDSYQLIALMKEWSGFEPKMWGPSIIGFGSYHYKYESGREGDMLIIGFSPRKAAISLYIAAPGKERDELLPKLGKHTTGKGCIYVKRLSDIDLNVLEKLCRTTLDRIKAES